MFGIGSSLFTLALFGVALIVIIRAIRVVPQQHAWIVERLGRFYAVLEPGLNFVIPFVDRVAFRHDLREIPLDVPSQVCITRDNTQLQVDGILYFQVTDPKLASYGSSTYIVAITQITAEREKRAVIATSEGRRQEQINVAEGAREAAIAKSEGEKQAEINNAQGQAAAILAIAEANAKAIRQVAEAIEAPGGLDAVNLKVAEQYIAAFGNLALKSNTLILPANAADVAGMIATAMSVIRPSARQD